MTRQPVPPSHRRPWRPDGRAVVWLAIALNCVVLVTLALLRHRAYWTARFDVGNMWQAVWTSAHGDLLLTTDIAGEQISRLAGHVDPLLLVFTPLAWITRSPVPLLVAQPIVVALGALPIHALARRHLGERAAVGCALAWLAYPPLWWLVLDEFHPVAFAAPLLAACVWAIDTRRDGWLAVFAVLAALSKEEVGLTLAALGLWMAWRHGRRLAGGILAALSAAWVGIAVGVIIPHYNNGQGSAFVTRYGALGESEGEVLRHVLIHPWELVTTGLAPDRLGYLAALALPLLLLPLGSSLALVAIPELAINLLADWPPQHSVEFHYTAVTAGILLPATVLGVANLVEGRLGVAARRFAWRTGPVVGALLAACAVGLAVTGPLPGFDGVSVASKSRLRQYERPPEAAALAATIAMIPDDAPLSTGNYPGAHVSARRYVATFPVIGRARFVLLDTRRPLIGFRVRRANFAIELARLRADPAFVERSARDGVLLFERTGPAPP